MQFYISNYEEVPERSKSTWRGQSPGLANVTSISPQTGSLDSNTSMDEHMASENTP